jgi:hypothetical protein
MLYSVKLRDRSIDKDANITLFLFSGILTNFNYCGLKFLTFVYI